jgi:prophage tail gpP-like protein
MSETIRLNVNGRFYGGWTNVRVKLGIEHVAGSFDLSVSEKWPGQTDFRALAIGDECRVFIGDTPIVTGYIDDVDPDYDKESHIIHISGRDKTGDLVDCSAIHKSGEWHNAKLEKICQDICTPFGIKVVVSVDTGKAFSRFAIHDGESAFECLVRCTMMRGILMISNGSGDLVLTRAGVDRISTPLILGQNIERGSGRFTAKDRYSKYIVKGQSVAAGWDATSTKHTSQKAVVEDTHITRYRPLIIIAEQGDGSTYKDRAIWERNVRYGRGGRVVYTVTGWRHATGLWLPNRLVKVTDAYMGLDEEQLIIGATMVLDENGSRTDIEVCRKEAFELINLPDKRKHKVQENLKW